MCLLHRYARTFPVPVQYYQVPGAVDHPGWQSHGYTPRPAIIMHMAPADHDTGKTKTNFVFIINLGPDTPFSRNLHLIPARADPPAPLA